MPIATRGPLFALLVPAVDAARLAIDPASAVVCDLAEWRGAAESVLVDLEGNRYGAENMQRYAQRVLHAAGRAAHAYPTIARSRLPRASFVQVGEYDLRVRRIRSITDPDRLRAHLSPEPLPAVKSDVVLQGQVRCVLDAMGVRGSGAEALIALAPRWTGKFARSATGLQLECVGEVGSTVDEPVALPPPLSTPAVLRGIASLLADHHVDSAG